MSESFPHGYIGPEYICHKRVHAAKITGFDFEEWQDTRFTRADHSRVLLHFDGAPSKHVRVEQVRGLEVGGYLVQHADGYLSFSPAKAFEEGYTLAPVDPGPPRRCAPGFNVDPYEAAQRAAVDPPATDAPRGSAQALRVMNAQLERHAAEAIKRFADGLPEVE